MDRHGRQDRLAEVGSRGQSRIASATADVRLRGLAGEVAARYLAGAGVGHLRVRDPEQVVAARSVDPSVRVELLGEGERDGADSHEADGDGDGVAGLRDPSAAAVARGARDALRVLRAILEVGS
jgi:hypothetical protein